jgi:fluoroacetyl-CoA thioesterase
VGPAGGAGSGPGTGLAAGLSASVRAVVTGADTAIAAGSGDVPVLSTPRLLALAEAATVAAVAGYLAQGTTSVGTFVSLEHRRATPVGAEIVVEAELTEVAGRRLVFSFIARDAGVPADDAGEHAVAGAGRVERVVVDREAFLARLSPPGP